MKLGTTNRTNRLNRLLIRGIICANTAPIGFAGVPGNFTFSQGGGQAPQNPAPLNGATQHVPNPQQQLPPTQSKINPGVTSTSTADPNTPISSLNGIPQGSSPLEKFSGLFDNKPQVDSSGKPIQKPVSVLDAGADSYRKVAEKLNFAPETLITPEQQAALVAGGEGAVPALLEVLNTFGREVYAQASATSTQVTKKGMEGYSAEQRSNIDKAIKLNGLSESLIAKDTRLADPAVAPLVNVVQQQIANKFPQATTQQLESYVVEYFNHAFGGFGKQVEQQQQQKEAAKPAFNFLEFVTGGAKK